MANQGAKKRKEENARHMAKLRRLIIATNVVYFVVRMLIFHSSFTWKHWIGLLVTSLAYAFPYKQLDQMAKPSVTDDGELIDGGFDMTTGGICGYMHDVIYITCFVQLASIISGKFWYTYLVIPAFGVYKASGLIRGFMSQGSEGAVEDEKSRKRERRWRGKLREGKSSRREQDECVVVDYIMKLWNVHQTIQMVNSLGSLNPSYMNMSTYTIFTMMGNSHRVEHSQFSGDRRFFL